MEILSIIVLLGLFFFVYGSCIAIEGVFKRKILSIFFGVIITLTGLALIDSPSNVIFSLDINKTNLFKIDNCQPILKTEIENHKYIYCSSGQIVRVNDEEYNSNQLSIVNADERILNMYNSSKNFYLILGVIYCLLVLLAGYYFYKLIKNCRKKINESNNKLER